MSQFVSQQEVVASLPVHLRPFVAIQDYGQYTPRDQAVWRYLLRSLSGHLAKCAHPVYLEGLARTGIALDHIPSIDEMNVCLAKLGWRAVVVDGFIPPAIFMEFQALKVLVIALEMRTVEHIEYTPAPDIVHEAAGHAPFIVDVDYAEFLQRFGEIGMKAIASHQDLKVYDAIRALSIIKEQPGASAQAIADAEANLRLATQADGEPSEASLLSRLHWWTVEYGLVGEVHDYCLFGAGLLSSLGESIHCLDDEMVRKIPLTVDAVMVPYDITSEQPQLFVTRSCKHLSQVLEEYAASMCFIRGGASSLRTAVRAQTICTAQYDSGVQVSGVLSEVLCDAVDNAIYVRTEGPTQLAWRGVEIYGQGISHHPHGFGSPIGMLKDFSRCLSQYTFDELKAHNLCIGERVRLEFLSGVTVNGHLEQIHRQEHRNLVLTFTDCRVTDLAGNILFDPEWGVYDMAVGANINSVFGGTADRDKYRLYDVEPRAEAGAAVDASDSGLMALYEQVDRLTRSDATTDLDQLPGLLEALKNYPQEWLLRVELLACLERHPASPQQVVADLRSELQLLGENVPAFQALIARVLQG